MPLRRVLAGIRWCLGLPPRPRVITGARLLEISLLPDGSLAPGFTVASFYYDDLPGRIAHGWRQRRHALERRRAPADTPCGGDG